MTHCYKPLSNRSSPMEGGATVKRARTESEGHIKRYEARYKSFLIHFFLVKIFCILMTHAQKEKTHLLQLCILWEFER